MSIETILESVNIDYAQISSGKVTSVVGDKTLTISGAVWTGAAEAGDFVSWIGDDGSMQSGVVASVTDANNLELTHEAQVAASNTALNTVFVAGDNTPPLFQAVESWNKVPIRQAVSKILQTTAGHKNISKNEGILIKSVYVRLPYQFTFADTFIDVAFTTRQTTTPGDTVISQIGEGDGVLRLPVENVEIPVNVYVPPNADAGSNDDTWNLQADVNSGYTGSPPSDTSPPIPSAERVTISTVNMPNVLETQILPVIIGVRVLHAATALTT